MYQYPYGNAQQLNLDWILSKLQEIESGSGGGADLEEVANALVSASFDATIPYRKYDYAFCDGKLYRALHDTIGAFNPADWMEVTLGADIPVLTRLVNADSALITTLQNQLQNLGSDEVANESTVTGTTVSDALGNLNGAIEDVADDLADEVTARANANDTILSSVAYVEETNTATRTYAVGDYVYIKQYERLYRITTATPSGTTLVGHIQYMVNGGLNDVPFAVPIAVQAISNAYIDLTLTHSFFYIYKFGSIYVGKFRLGTLTQIPTGTADFKIAVCSLPFALSDDAYFNIVSNGSGGTMQLKISSVGNVYCSNYSGKDAAGFYNGSFIAM